MNGKKQPDKSGGPAPDEMFRRKLAAKRARSLRARQQGERPAWFGLGMFGLVGWSVALPTVALTALGVWIDRRWTGPQSWTLMLLVIGIGLGCINAWFWVSRERREIEAERNEEQVKEPHEQK